MARASLSISIAAITGAANVFDMGGATGRIEVVEIGIFANTAVTADLALFRTTAVGTRTTPTSFLPEDPAHTLASGASMATAWSVAPTVAATALRRVQIPANVGSGVIWTWPDDALYIANGLTLIVTQSATAPAYRGYVIIEE